MSFTNIQDAGAWKQGGTYTFDWIPEDNIDYGAEIRYYGYTLLTDGCSYEGTSESNFFVTGNSPPPDISSLGEILFSTGTEVDYSPSPGTVINDLIDSGLAVVTNITDVSENQNGTLYRYTVVLSADIPVGTYYLKAADYDYIESPG